MKVLYYQVLLEKNEHFSTPVWVYPWEMQIFAAAHRNSGITELGKAAFNKRFPPDAATEYDRLSNKYKGPEGSDMSYCASVYGHGSDGVRKLHERMVEAAAETEAFLIREATEGPAEKPKVDAPEFASPFGEVDKIPDAALGIETQGDLRKFVGGDEPTVTVA